MPEELLLDEALGELPDELLDELLEESSELEGARLSTGRSGSRSAGLLDELDELFELDGPFEELVVLSLELDGDRRNTGRLPELFADALPEEWLPDEWLPDELLPDELLPEALLPDEAMDELLVEVSEFGLGRGREVSSVPRDASECSSAVPSLTRVILTAL